MPAKPVVLTPGGRRKVFLCIGVSGYWPLYFFTLPSSARVFHSLHISRMNPDTVAIAAAMKRIFSIIGDHSLRKRSAARVGLCWQRGDSIKRVVGRGRVPFCFSSYSGKKRSSHSSCRKVFENLGLRSLYCAKVAACSRRSDIPRAPASSQPPLRRTPPARS